jgi:hypothetical protein
VTDRLGSRTELAGDELVARRESGPPRRLSFDEAHHRRGRELATVVSDLDRRRVIEVLPGCSRKVIERWLAALPGDVRAGIEVVSIDPAEAYRQAIWAARPHARIVCERFRLARGANTALDAVRRGRQRNARPKKRLTGVNRSGQYVRWRPELYHVRHRLLKASERPNAREHRLLCELFARDPVLAEAWGLKEAVRSINRSRRRSEAERRLDTFLIAVDHAGLPPFDAFAKGIRLWREELRPLRRTDDQRPRRRRHQQGQSHQAPRLRTTDLRRLPKASRHSLRLARQHDATPFSQQEPTFQPARSTERGVNSQPALRGQFSTGLDTEADNRGDQPHSPARPLLSGPPFQPLFAGLRGR